ncbi:MAG: hypothetical protein AAF548_00290 [Actinomycetota bacterium]
MGEDTATDTAAAQPDMVSDLVDRALDTIDKVRVSGTENVVRLVRGIVYGLVAFVFLVASVIFFVVIAIRLADAYLPIGTGVGDASWAAHLYVGGMLSIVGFGFWSSRKNTGMGRVGMAAGLAVVITVVIACYAIFGQ